MKQLIISDEMYDKLMGISHQLVTQDNRSTAMPYIFQIRTIENAIAPDGCGTRAYYNPELEIQIESEEEIKETVFEYLNWDIENGDHKSIYDGMSDVEIGDILMESGFREFFYEEKEVFHNAFLTEKACRDHIKYNYYHYNKPVDYLTHAFRNPELETVLEFLHGLNDQKKHI